MFQAGYLLAQRRCAVFMAGCLEMVGRVFDGLQKFGVRTISPSHLLRRPGMNVAAVMGLLLSAFLWAYAFAQLPAGGLVDRFGPRRLLGAGILLWSIAQGLTGLCANFGQFVFGRAILGLGEAPQFPTGARVVRDWFNVRGRGLATGVFNCSSTLGTAIAAPQVTKPARPPASPSANGAACLAAPSGKYTAA